jgi:hypothetical protein
VGHHCDGQPRSAGKHVWQLLFRPAGTASWSDQVESTATATNGGLVLASAGGRSLIVGVRPAEDFTFSPLISTDDAARSWSNGLLTDGLAAHPDALATDAAGHASPSSMSATVRKY